MTPSPESRAEALLDALLEAGTIEQLGRVDPVPLFAAAIREAENAAEQRAIDRCREIIARAVITDKTDGEGMRRLLLVALDPRWDTVASLLKHPKD